MKIAVLRIASTLCQCILIPYCSCYNIGNQFRECHWQ